MARNTERDAREAEIRKNRILDAGFRLFSKRGIESVKLQEVADEADVGQSTLYNYYQNKTNLVVAISAKIWGGFWRESLTKHSMEELESFNAYQLIEFYLDRIITLYKEKPEILRFSGNYKNYVRIEGASSDELKAHTDALSPINELFHRKYEQARTDKSIRTDIPEKKLFLITSINILAIAERYALGLVWADDNTNDYLDELNYTRQMILSWVKGQNQEERVGENI